MMWWWAELDDEARGKCVRWLIGITIGVAILAIFPGSANQSNGHARLRPSKAGCFPGQVMAPDGRCSWRDPGDTDPPARVAARAEKAADRASARPDGNSDGASDPNPEGVWVDTAVIVLGLAVAAVTGFMFWREARPRLVRPAGRRRPYRAA